MPKGRSASRRGDALSLKKPTLSSVKQERHLSGGSERLLQELRVHQVELEMQNEELRRVRSELEESRERFIDLYEFAPVGYLSLSKEGFIEEINHTATQLFGFEKSHLIQRSFSSLAEKESAGAFYLHQRQVLDSAAKQVCELVLIRKDGTTFAAQLESIRAERDGQRVIRTVLTDITERKVMEKKLEEQGRHLRAIADYTYDWESWHDLDGRLLWVNPAVYRLTGYTPEECMAMPDYPLPLIDMEDRERMAGLFAEAIGGSSGNDVEFRILCRDGSLKWGAVSWQSIYDTDGSFLGVRSSIRDITDRKKTGEALRRAHDDLDLRVQERTSELREAYNSLEREMEERKRAEEQLRLSQKMKAVGTLSGGIAHDFNNILTGIIGFTEMALDEISPESRAHRRLELVLKSGLRGRDLVRQILAFSRQTSHEHRPIALSQAIKEGLKLLRPLLPSTIEIRVKDVADGDMILSDPAQIHQVLMNLCTNGAQAMARKGGVLEIAIEKDRFSKGSLPSPEMKAGNYVILSVRDTGSGMKPEVLERIFDPFFSTRTNGGGTGLGLSVVHGIVKSHGGSITVESEPGKGSTFRIYFPRTGKQEGLALSGREEIKGGRECILFVDDEDILVELNRERLTQLGYRVVATMSSIEALEMFKKDPGKFDLVITDYTMPDMTGVDLAKRLLSIRADIPIILSTGYNDNISPSRARKAGVREFLLKPQGKRELDLIIRSILDINNE